MNKGKGKKGENCIKNALTLHVGEKESRYAQYITNIFFCYFNLIVELVLLSLRIRFLGLTQRV